MYLTPLEVGLYESGATLTSVALLSVLALTHQVAEAPAANTFCWISCIEDGAETVDNFIRTKNVGDLGDEACGISGTHSFSSSDRMLRIRFSSSSATYYIPMILTNA